MKRIRSISPIDGKIPDLDGAIRKNITMDGPLENLLRKMMEEDRTSAENYRAALNRVISEERQGLIEVLGIAESDHQPELVTFDAVANKVREDTEAVLSAT